MKSPNCLNTPMENLKHSSRKFEKLSIHCDAGIMAGKKQGNVL